MLRGSNFKVASRKKIIRITVVCLLILIFITNLFAQYRGAPVKKERLLKALRSKQLQTSDIVAVINSNGVDFKLTPEVRKALIAAGARPEVLRAVAENLRFTELEESLFAQSEKVGTPFPYKPPDYDELLDQALIYYKEQSNPQDAVQFLRTAVRIKPEDPKAYQMLGFINLYGLNNLSQSEKIMRESISKGGSAVFRVYHDDTGKFTGHCSGSLFISPERIRFESDDNIHTFETSTVNIDRIKLDHESTKVWKDHSVFKVFLKIGNDKASFRFAPVTGREDESKMFQRMVLISKISPNQPVQGMVSFR